MSIKSIVLTQLKTLHFLCIRLPINVGHSFDFKNTRILDKESHYYRRLNSEIVHIILYINTKNNIINKQSDSDKLNATYRPLFNRVKKL